MPSARPHPPGQPVFQLHVRLEDIAPVIWRRVLVPGSVRLSKLHDMLQAAMGWTDSHLHAFRDQGRFVYEYDFGDSWSHDVVIEDFRGNRSG